MRKLVRITSSGLIIALMFVFGLSLTTTAAAAGEAEPRESITLSPVNKRYQFDAGSTHRDEMTIVNDGEVAYDFILYARPYSVQNSSYTSPDFTATIANADAYQWVQFDQARYHIEPNQTVKAPYTVRIPKDAAPGGHYGVLFAETQPSGKVESVARKKRVGMILYATVNGQYIMSGKTLDSSIPFLQFRAPLTVNTTIQNDGNSDFVVNTELKVSDLFGGRKYSATKDYPVLPKTKRQIVLNWDNAPWFGLYKVDVKTSFLDQKHSDSSYVLIAPRWLLIVLALTIAGGVLYVVLRRRH